MGLKVTSSKMCFFYGRRFRPGEVFELPDNVKPSPDMKVVDEPKKEQPKKDEPKKSGPSTFSEMNK